MEEIDSLRQQLTNAIDERDIARKESAATAQLLAASEAREAAMREIIVRLTYPLCLCGANMATDEPHREGCVVLAALSAAPSVPREEQAWLCGCGAWIGVNLSVCAACNRPRSEGEAQRKTKPFNAADEIASDALNTALASLRTEHERVKAELARLMDIYDDQSEHCKTLRRELDEAVTAKAAAFLVVEHSTEPALRADLEQRTKERDDIDALCIRHATRCEELTKELDEWHDAYLKEKNGGVMIGTPSPASVVIANLAKERDEARAQHERLRERAGELVGYNVRDAQELERLRQYVVDMRKVMEKAQAICAQRDNSYFFDMLKEWEEDWLIPALATK